MLAVCPHCGSSLVERRNRVTGLPYLACSGDPTCPGTVASLDGNGLPRPARAQAVPGSSRGRWWRAARRAIWSLTD
jgi:ssDNA-binding Zn-finger/Zn-ribbon topoisomerase 1